MTRHDSDQLTGPDSPESRQERRAARSDHADHIRAGGHRGRADDSSASPTTSRKANSTKPTPRSPRCEAERASLQQIKQEVDRFESEKGVLQQRIDVIETLQKNRTGGQDLLQMVANTVVHVDSLWLTSLNRTGNSIDIARRSRLDQLRGEFHHATEAVRLLRQRGDQDGHGRRFCAVGGDLRFLDERCHQPAPPARQDAADRSAATSPQPAKGGRS